MRWLPHTLWLAFSACGASELVLTDALGEAGGGGGAGASAGAGGSGGAGGAGGAIGLGGGGSGTGGGAAGCSAATCNGCCALGVCQPGQSRTACGVSGAACVTCLNGQVCRADRTCGADSATIEPASLWRVQPTSATIAPTQGASEWDELSAPDPEVSLWCPASSSATTATAPKMADTFNPTWASMTGECEMTAAALKSTGFAFAVNELDLFGSETIVAKTTVRATDAELLAGRLTIPAMGGLQSMTVQLVRQ